MDLRFYNTLSRKKEVFKSLKKGVVNLYTCGPTVYQRAHIGNLRTYIFEDILKRTLLSLGFRVKHVMNITDVGHLTSDEDSGEDKVEKEARRKKMSARTLTRFFEKEFKKDIKELSILPPDIWARATEHIKEQIDLIKILEKKGYAYKTKQAIYFDTSRFKDYGELSGQKHEDKKVGAREDVVVDKEKKNPKDFSLWFFTIGHFKDHVLRWRSPWGIGFPGWHIECSAMSMKYLGSTFDIHAGGIDHIPIHHPNEIAQSEAASGKKFVKYWLHGNFLLLNKKRMGKSEQNTFTLDELEERGFHALDFRYFVLGAKYRSPLFFSWEALEAAASARDSLNDAVRKLAYFSKNVRKGKKRVFDTPRFFTYVYDDFDIPGALAYLWKRFSVYNKAPAKYNANTFLKSILDIDIILGLGLDKAAKVENPPASVLKLIKQREEFRKSKQWSNADVIRKKIRKQGWQIEDLQTGPYPKKLT